jgi:hypothetical protein
MMGLSIATMVGAKFGLGAPDSGESLMSERHADLAEIRPEDAMTLKKSIYAFTVLYNPALMATKTAILLLYIRGRCTPFSSLRFIRYTWSSQYSRNSPHFLEYLSMSTCPSRFRSGYRDLY